MSVYRCNMCGETWSSDRTNCPLCESTEIIRSRAYGSNIVYDAERTVTSKEYPSDLTLGAKEWESLTIQSILLEEKHQTMTGVRYGVDCRPMPSRKHPGEIEWTPVSSLPDFEGVLMDGPQFVIENKKVASRKSFPLNDDKFKKRQLSHLLRRDKFGAVCMLLLHFNPRELKKGPTDSETFAIPVSESHEFWQRHASGDVKSLSPEDAATIGFRVPWGAKYRSRTVRPLILETILAIREMREECWLNMRESNAIIPTQSIEDDAPF